MRIVQLIDTLEPGGAERMAVNYANALVKKITFSGLIATRSEGLLLAQIDERVSYNFLKKRKVIDFQAIRKLRKYLIENKIDIIHAHSSSFFAAVLVKFTLPNVKIVWHDHYGISQDLVSRKNLVLKFFSYFFLGIIAVNSELRYWAKSYLFCSNSIYLPNFIEDSCDSNETVTLKGEEGKRIICVANLRPQKNHNLIVDAAAVLKNKFPDWSFHLFGKNFEDLYATHLLQKVRNLKLQENVFFYGAINNIGSALQQCDIAVLPSLSEGLPLALLEYGLNKLPVVVTDVGEIPNIVISGEDGIIIQSSDLNGFTIAIENLISDKIWRKELGLRLYCKISENYSEKIIIDRYLLKLDRWLGCAL
ncbi:glycosyltransferase [Flavobacterium sp. LHD-80]|uniref:glycosyltransferase n=1 Tax=Flavobacterium sp. LHD-80 TaxID=3071411 RepID=UPI0027E1A0AC|nr:glycosyltransferase [Flavobacterium sp. LHD-80]MDQ6472103.1 glycosyltransferase [Flavobacterium sp. LHD-80]